MRQLDEAQMDKLHPTTLTALLPPEQPEIHYAHPALEDLAARDGAARSRDAPGGCRSRSAPPMKRQRRAQL